VQFLPLPSIGTDLDLTSVIEHPDFQGCATITVGNETREVKAGGIVVIPANTPHRFVNSGNTTLRQIDIHASPRFIQMNLT